MRFLKKITIMLVMLGFTAHVLARKIGTSAPKTEPKIQVKKEEPKKEEIKLEEKKVEPVKPQLFELDEKYYTKLDTKTKVFNLKKIADDESSGVWIRLKSGDVPMMTEDGSESNFEYVMPDFKHLVDLSSRPEGLDFRTMTSKMTKETKEDQQRIQEEELKKKKLEEENRKQEELKKTKLEADKKEKERIRLEDERKKQEEKKKLEEEKRLKDEENKKKQEEIERKKLEEEKRKQEELKKKQEDEKKRLEEENRKQEELKKTKLEADKKEKERIRLEDERKKQEEKKKLEEEKRLKDEENKKKQEEIERKKLEEEKRKQEELKKTKLEADKKEKERIRLEDERKKQEEKKKLEEEKRLKDEENKKKQEEIERKKLEEEKRKQEELKKKQEDEKKRLEADKKEKERIRLEDERKKEEEKKKKEATSTGYSRKKFLNDLAMLELSNNTQLASIDTLLLLANQIQEKLSDISGSLSSKDLQRFSVAQEKLKNLKKEKDTKFNTPEYSKEKCLATLSSLREAVDKLEKQVEKGDFFSVSEKFDFYASEAENLKKIFSDGPSWYGPDERVSLSFVQQGLEWIGKKLEQKRKEEEEAKKIEIANYSKEKYLMQLGTLEKYVEKKPFGSFSLDICTRLVELLNAVLDTKPIWATSDDKKRLLVAQQKLEEAKKKVGKEVGKKEEEPDKNKLEEEKKEEERKKEEEKKKLEEDRKKKLEEELKKKKIIEYSKEDYASTLSRLKKTIEKLAKLVKTEDCSNLIDIEIRAAEKLKKNLDSKPTWLTDEDIKSILDVQQKLNDLKQVGKAEEKKEEEEPKKKKLEPKISEETQNKKQLEEEVKTKSTSETSELEKRAKEFKEFKAGLEETQKYTYASRGLLVFLDDSEKDLGGVSLQLLLALSQNPGPIITSASVLVNLFSAEKKKGGKESAETLIKRLNKVQLSRGAKDRDPQDIKDEKDIHLKISGFNENNWVIKKISNLLYLFIPHAYIKKELPKTTVDLIKEYNPKKISTTELLFGLKVNHMESMTIDGILKQKIEEQKHAGYFVKALNDIFCTRVEYKNQMGDLPQWTIYIIGHGYIGSRIVDLSLDDFKKVLAFLETKINTKLFVYMSCYSAGTNTEKIYKDAESAIQKTYSFAIITQALTDATVSSQTGYDIENNELRLKGFAFSKFLESTKPDTTNYETVAQHLFPLTSTLGWANTPQIKLPGLEWFSVMAGKKDVVSIGDILAKSRDPKQPLDIVKYFKTEPRGLLLYTTNIPFELVINTKNLASVISMVPGDAFTKIQKISSSKTLSETIDWFMTIDSLASEKIFFIGDLSSKDKTVKNVVIWAQEGKRYAFFADGKKVFKKNIGKKDLSEVATNQQKEYKECLLKAEPAKSKGEKPLAEIGAIVYNTKSDMAVLKTIKTSCIIEKIDSKSATLDDICSTLMSYLDEKTFKQSGAFVLVKAINGKMSKNGWSSMLADESANEGDMLTIKNVIIEPSVVGGKIPRYFSYKDLPYELTSDEYGTSLAGMEKDYLPQYITSLAGLLLPSAGATPEGIGKIKESLTKHKKN